MKRFIQTTGTVLLCLFLPLVLQAQHYFDSGLDDLSSGLRYDSVRKNYFFLSYTSRSFFDTATQFSRINLTPELEFESVQRVDNPRTDSSYNRSIHGIENWNQGAFTYEFNPFDRDTNGVGRIDLKLHTLQDSMLVHTVELVPDSAYGAAIHSQKRIGDTVYIKAGWSQGKYNPEFIDILYKYNITNRSLTAYQPPSLTIAVPTRNDSARFTFGGGLHRLPNGDWITDAILYGSDGTWFSRRIAHLNPDFSEVKQVWPVAFSLMSHASYMKIWVSGSRVYAFGTGYRPDPNNPGKGYDDFSLHTFDIYKDTIPERYYFERLDSTKDHDDVAGNAAYFDGEHFVLGGLIDHDPSINTRYSLDLITVDTNFQVINRMSVADSNYVFNGSTFNSIIPHPDSAGKVIYSGNIYSPAVNDDSDLFWGTYSIKPTVSQPEMPKLVKAQVYIYPVPSNGKFHFLFTGEDFKPYKITIYTTSGKPVASYRITTPRESIDTDLAAGVYHVFVQMDKHVQHQKIIIH